MVGKNSGSESKNSSGLSISELFNLEIVIKLFDLSNLSPYKAS